MQIYIKKILFTEILTANLGVDTILQCKAMYFMFKSYQFKEKDKLLLDVMLTLTFKPLVDKKTRYVSNTHLNV